MHTEESVSTDLLRFAYPAIPATGTYKVFATFEDTDFEKQIKNLEIRNDIQPRKML